METVAWIGSPVIHWRARASWDGLARQAREACRRCKDPDQPPVLGDQTPLAYKISILISTTTSPSVSSGATVSSSVDIRSPTDVAGGSSGAALTATAMRRSRQPTIDAWTSSRPRRPCGTAARRAPGSAWFRRGRATGRGRRSSRAATRAARDLPDVPRRPSSVSRKRGSDPVSSSPRSTGRNGRGTSPAPVTAAIDSAAASACWAAMPPCFTENAVMSPAA